MGVWPSIFLFPTTCYFLSRVLTLEGAFVISLVFSACIGMVGATVTVLSGLLFNQIIFRKDKVE